MSSTFSRLLHLSLANFWRHKFLSLSTILVMGAILFIFNIIITVHFLSTSVIAVLNQKVDIISYLQDQSDYTEVNNLLSELKELPEVKEVSYTSKEQALQELLGQYPDQEDPFAKYGLANKLPANIRIVTYNPEDHQKIISFLQNGKYADLLIDIESNIQNQQIANHLIRLTNFTRHTLWVIIVAYIFGSLLIIKSAIQLGIHSRRQEIQIMNLVGASYPFIYQPFIFEGILLGALAVILSSFLFGLFLRATPLEQIGLSLSGTTLLIMLLIELLLSGLIGMISSWLSVKKYLKEK